MSTKNLARTVIEGGRAGGNKYDRRQSHKEQRATERAYMADLRKDPDHFDEDMVQERSPVSKEFTDKLSPMYRWLESQVGRPWADVRSEVFEKFDTRTTAGRHITFDHLLKSVVDTRTGRDSRGFIAAKQPGFSWRYHEYYVSADGIFTKNPPREKYSRTYRSSDEELAEAGKWLQGRMVGEKGGVLYWFGPNDGLWEAKWSKEMEETPYGIREGYRKLRYYNQVAGEFKVKILGFAGGYETITRTGLHWEYVACPAGFKQRGALTQSEREKFKSFADGIQEEILFYTSNR